MSVDIRLDLLDLVVPCQRRALKQLISAPLQHLPETITFLYIDRREEDDPQ